MRKRYAGYLVFMSLCVLTVAMGIILWGYRRMSSRAEETEMEIKPEYINELLLVSLENYLSSGEGTIKQSPDEEEHAWLRFKIQEDCLDSVMRELEKSCGEPMDESDYSILPNYSDNALAIQMKSERILYMYCKFAEGKKAKTRSLDIYITENVEGQQFLYLFG